MTTLTAPRITVLPSPKSIRTTRQWEEFLKALSTSVKREVEEVRIPAVQVIAVSGNEPPASKQFQNAIAVLYGIAYGLKMGLKFGKLPRPEGYFDFRIAALDTLWWSEDGVIDISNPKTLRWQAYLMLPAFIDRKLVERAREAALAKHPEIPYGTATLTTVNEGRSVQILHVGPYDKEQPTIEELHEYIADHGLAVKGKHHEVYISDPRRTKPDKLKTVIRLPVKRAATR
ncbi:MAG TPA: GyrI-like domain-containing protein [Rhodothermia bacterium]|nr:GyrI-like domain-containing protein [Rhodothermia bacterium]